MAGHLVQNAKDFGETPYNFGIHQATYNSYKEFFIRYYSFFVFLSRTAFLNYLLVRSEGFFIARWKIDVAVVALGVRESCSI